MAQPTVGTKRALSAAALQIVAKKQAMMSKDVGEAHGPASWHKLRAFVGQGPDPVKVAARKKHAGKDTKVVERTAEVSG